MTVIMVIGNIGAGKSTVIRYLNQLTRDNGSSFHHSTEFTILQKLFLKGCPGFHALPQGGFIVMDKGIYDTSDAIIKEETAYYEQQTDILAIELVWPNPARKFPEYLSWVKVPTHVWYITSPYAARIKRIAHRNVEEPHHFIADEVLRQFPNHDDYFLPLIKSREYGTIYLIENNTTQDALYIQVQTLWRAIMSDTTMATDFLVATASPELLDDTLQAMMNARVVGRGTPGGIVYQEGYPVVRVFGDTGFFTFAMESQGYCKIMKQLEETL